MPRFCALLLAFPLLLQAGATEAPVRERLDLRLLSLNRLTLQAAPERQAGLLPAKQQQLPLSVQIYLKPSGQLNHLSGPIQKAAARIRRQVAPGSAQKDRLRESPRLAEAVRLWLDEALPLDPAVAWSAEPSTDLRLAWPRASAILTAGKADAEGRACVAVAVLRALGVPARTAWARGQLTAEYWAPLAPEKPAPEAPKPKLKGKAGKRSSAPRPPLGWWEPLDPSLDPAEIDAYSLDAGVLGRLHWHPEQQLRQMASGWERAVFAAGDSLAARAAYEASLGLGVLTQTAGALASLSEAARTAEPGATFYILTWQRYELETEGAMASMDPVDLLTPYRPHLASWGRELPGRVRELELEAQGFWSDRPKHLRGDPLKPRDEWKSVPPSLGHLHYASTGVRRMRSVLQALRDGDQVRGVLLRADNLSPRAGWALGVHAPGTTLSARSISSGANGHFGLTLTAAELAWPWVELSTPFEKDLLWRGDHQRLLGPNAQK